jgi:alkylhydroperoxidase family enzyme
MEPRAEARIPLSNSKRPTFERLLERSPPVLSGFIAFRKALGKVKLSPELRSRTALLVAEAYGCEHALSEAVKEAQRLGIPGQEIDDARRGFSKSHVACAVLRFVEAVIYAHGRISNAELDELLDAGFTPTAAVEIVAHVALSVSACLFTQVAALAPEGERVIPFYEQE